MSSPMYVQLGESGLRVSRVIFGTMSLGSSEWQEWVLNEKESLPLLKAAYDQGVTTWDTADMYSNGESERIIGKALKEYKIPRDRVQILTKCFNVVNEGEPGFMNMGVDEDDARFINARGLSRSAIFNAVNASLKRLDTDYIDLLQIHRADRSVKHEETMRALHDLVVSGKVRYIGASSMRAWEMATYQHVADKHGLTKFVSMQDQVSLLYREEEREMIPYCKATGVGLIPWYPLHSGKLARPLDKQMETTRADVQSKGPFHQELSEADKEIIRRVEKIAKDKKLSMAQVSFLWCAQKVTAPLVGISKAERLQEFVDVIKNGTKLTDEEVKHLEEPYQPKPVFGHA